MIKHLAKIFEDKDLVEKIKKRLPYLFQIAEIESSRAGKIGMEVGSLRERMLVALLIHRFGEENVKTDIPITKAEVDVELFGEPISIKTITGKGFNGVKLIWTVDAQKAKEFRENYQPNCDILLIQINWGAVGGFYYVPVGVQKKIFQEMGRNRYIKLPKPGTNPRGAEITKEALTKIANSKETNCVRISWQKTKLDYDPYKKWVDYWKE